MPPLQKLKAFLEKGARNNIKDAKLLQSMHDNTVTMGATCGTMRESVFSHTDLISILSAELKEDIDSNAYILDVFDTNLVYATGYSWSSGGSESYQIDYTVSDNGDVTWGAPVEVVRKVTYVPTVVDATIGETIKAESGKFVLYSKDGSKKLGTYDTKDEALKREKQIQAFKAAESATDIDITTGEIALVEKAVSTDGTVMLKLISAGVGSSGFYSKEVLQRDGPKVFTKGLFNLIDHPTVQQEKDRPEGSVLNVGSTLKEDAQWYDSWKDKNGVDQGAGLYAPAVVKPTFREDLSVIANDIGMSIRAKGKARMGTIDGKEMPIIESIDKALSVDYVTLPGRGGRVIDMMESARNAPNVKDSTMAIDEQEFSKLQEANRKLSDQVARLTEATARATALQTVDSVLQTYPTLPKTAKARVRRSFESNELAFTESGTLDAVKLTESIKNAVAEETAYLTQLGVGSVRGLGTATLQETETDPEKMYSAFVDSLNDL